ncbi:MAG TPA: hypothetical protein VKZ50_10895 [bacterium]|nr:hypothetical protein [bacterium]
MQDESRRDVSARSTSPSRQARAVRGRANELVRLLDEVLGRRGRYAWYEALGDLSLLTHVPLDLAAEWADLTAMDRAFSLCVYLEDCRVPIRDESGTQRHAAVYDPPPQVYGELARMLKDKIESLATDRAARKPPSPPRKPRKRRATGLESSSGGGKPRRR